MSIPKMAAKKSQNSSNPKNSRRSGFPTPRPAYPLAIKTSRLVADYEKRYSRKPAIMFLAKHGLFVTAKTAPDAMRTLAQSPQSLRK